MDYEKMTKAQLIEEIKNSVFLASSLDSKDKEISDLTKKFTEEISKLNEKIKSFDGSLPVDAVNKLIDTHKKQYEKAVSVANLYIEAYRDTLKLSKITLDMAISNEALLSEKII